MQAGLMGSPRLLPRYSLEPSQAAVAGLRQNVLVAQGIEQPPSKRQVAGSIPAERAKSLDG